MVLARCREAYDGQMELLDVRFGSCGCICKVVLHGSGIGRLLIGCIVPTNAIHQYEEPIARFRPCIRTWSIQPAGLHGVAQHKSTFVMGSPWDFDTKATTMPYSRRCTGQQGNFMCVVLAMLPDHRKGQHCCQHLRIDRHAHATIRLPAR